MSVSGPEVADNYDVFVSYSWRANDRGERVDAGLAERLQAALEDRGLHVWRDVNRIREGDVISTALEDGVRDSAVVVPLVSPLHQSSNVCRWELLYALAHARSGGRVPPVFAVLTQGRGIPPAYPTGVFEAHAYAWDGDDSGLSQLCDLIEKRVAAVRSEGGERPSVLHGWGVAGAPGVTGSRFVGRFPDLFRLYAVLVGGLAAMDAAATHHAPMLLLYGEPGMGKSSLAGFFAERFSGRFEHGVLWLDAAGDRVDARVDDDSQREVVIRSLSAGAERWLRDRAPAVDLSDLPHDPALRWERLRSRLAAHLRGPQGRLLVVVDDVPHGIGLADLAMGSDRVATLITSRSDSLAGQGADSIQVGPFQSFESLLLLTNARDPNGTLRRQGQDPWRGTEAVAAELADEVGHHPMAVDLLGLRLRDLTVDAATLLQEVRRTADEFIDVKDVFLPLQHKASILATVSGSLRTAVHADQAAASVLRLLAVAPPARPVRLDAISFALLPEHVEGERLVEELAGQGLLRRSRGADGTQAAQHQIVHAVSRELWRRNDDPFTSGNRPPEPDLSYRFAQWHYGEGERLRNVDDAKAAETHGVALHVLAQARSTWPPGRQQAIEVAYGLLAQARLTYRAGTDTNDVRDYDDALGVIEQAEEALLPFCDHYDVQFAYHTAEALRGLVMSKGSGAPGDRVRAAREALDVILAADNERSRIAEIVLVQPEEATGLNHDYVRDVLARSRYNIPGRAISIVKALMDERPDDDWAAQARQLLADAERSYGEVLELRRQLWGEPIEERSRILSQASSEHGIGMVRYYAALLPAPPTERLARLGSALPQLLLGLQMRDTAGNETDVCKSLALLLKALLAASLLRTKDLDPVLVAQRARWDDAVARAERFRGQRYAPGAEPPSPGLEHRNDLRNRLVARLQGLGHHLEPDADLDGVLNLVVGWLALAYVADIWRVQTPATPDNVVHELRQLLEAA